MVEKLLQSFIGVVDTQLLKAVELQNKIQSVLVNVNSLIS